MESFKTQMYSHAKTTKGDKFATEMLKVMETFAGDSFKISEKPRKVQCIARSGRTGEQCTRGSKHGSEFCGLHGPYFEPKRCSRCSRNGEDIFHSAKWEHFGRIDQSIPCKVVKTIAKILNKSETSMDSLKANTNEEKCTVKTKSKQENTKPKRGLNKYMAFTKAKRSEVSTMFPNMSPKDVTRELSRRWKCLNEEDRLPYIQTAQEDKERYNREMIEWKKQRDAMPPVNNCKLPSTVEPPTSEAPTPTVEPPTSEAPTPTVEPPMSEAPTPTVEPPTSEAPTPTVEPPIKENPTTQSSDDESECEIIWDENEEDQTM